NFGGTYTILYKQRTAAGTWLADEQVLTTVTANVIQTSPQVVVDSAGNVHVMWLGPGVANPSVQNVHYRRRAAGTTPSWGTEEMVTDVNVPQVSLSLAIGPSDNVHAVWVGAGWAPNPNTPYTHYRRRLAATGAWQAPEIPTDNEGGNNALAIDTAENVHLLF